MVGVYGVTACLGHEERAKWAPALRVQRGDVLAVVSGDGERLTRDSYKAGHRKLPNSGVRLVSRWQGFAWRQTKRFQVTQVAA
jgi:hypothetical protein